ncbi:MAG: GNAT family N-acetyltransferase [Nitratireductor sp.]
MASIPLNEETSVSSSSTLNANLAGVSAEAQHQLEVEIQAAGVAPRRLAVYPASAGFDLVDELDFLCVRTVEPNIFFNPRFLAPAMPRLEDREVRLAVIRDGDRDKNRLRLLVPFSVEKPAVPLGVPAMRTWSSPFGPLGTPLVDRDDPVGVLEDFFSMLGRKHLNLPRVLILPDLRMDGPVARLIRTAAMGLDLPVVTTSHSMRPFLDSDLDGETYLRTSLKSHHVREFRRLKRRLAETGDLVYSVARQPDEIRNALETFLALEASGWKGRERTAMVIDRYRAAFAREAINRLAQRDLCRIHTLSLDGVAIASLIVFVEAGQAYTWKTAYDENHAAFSPGTLLMIEVTRQHLDDPNIEATDSCAVPDHPIMSRLWSERREMGTMVVGLAPDTDRLTRQAAGQIHLHRETRNLARILRRRIKGLIGRH